jgi:para-aminobenzoate synthetase
MEIIESLERAPRGVYSGALGFISLDGQAADLNIVIRTAVVTPRNVTVGAGGAVVALSDRQAEYEEMVLKANAVARVVGGAGGEPAAGLGVLAVGPVRGEVCGEAATVAPGHKVLV